MDSKVKKDSLLRKPSSQKEQARHSRGMMFLEAAMLLPMAAVVTVGLAYYANAYVTKTRLGDSARVIARAIQDDPGITQGGLWSSAGDLERVISEATGTSEEAPAGFNVTTYKKCNPELASSSDDSARRHFETAGRFEKRRGVFGDCNVESKVGERDVRVSIASHATRPSKSQIEGIIPPDGADANGIHPSGRAHSPGYTFGWKYANPNPNPAKPYWVSVVTKKPVPQISLFGWTFGSSPALVNHAVVRVVPDPNSITLFQHCTFGDQQPGFVATIKPGRYASMAELGSGELGWSMDNQLSSLRIPPGTQVTLYDGENFTGNSITLTEDAGCLNASTQNFNDLTSSLVVERTPASVRVDYSKCRKVSNQGEGPIYVSRINCEPGEFLATHSAYCEVPGSKICAGTSRGFMHTNEATPTSATVDCFSDNWTGEACSYVEGLCCPTGGEVPTKAPDPQPKAPDPQPKAPAPQPYECRKPGGWSKTCPIAGYGGQGNYGDCVNVGQERTRYCTGGSLISNGVKIGVKCSTSGGAIEFYELGTCYR